MFNDFKLSSVISVLNMRKEYKEIYFNDCYDMAFKITCSFLYEVLDLRVKKFFVGCFERVQMFDLSYLGWKGIPKRTTRVM